MHQSLTIQKGHGRIETRLFWTTSASDGWLKKHPSWSRLTSIGVVEATRQIGTKTSTECRYYISSLASNAKVFAKATRAHWSIENSLHWVLDVSFREDHSRIRSQHSPENLSILRNVVLNLIRQEKTVKRGSPQKRLKAAFR